MGTPRDGFGACGATGPGPPRWAAPGSGATGAGPPRWQGGALRPTVAVRPAGLFLPDPIPGMVRSCTLVALLAAHFLATPASAQRPTVTIIGTGSMASAMGPRVAAAGYPVVYGSRNPDRPTVVALVEETGPGTRALGQEEAAQAGDLVVLAVNWEVMDEVTGNPLCLRRPGGLRGPRRRRRSGGASRSGRAPALRGVSREVR